MFDCPLSSEFVPELVKILRLRRAKATRLYLFKDKDKLVEAGHSFGAFHEVEV